MRIGEQVSYERQVRRSAEVDTVEQAFAFCLTGIEEEGIELPVVTIEPKLIWDETAGEGTVVFDVSVGGPVRVEGPGDDD